MYKLISWIIFFTVSAIVFAKHKNRMFKMKVDHEMRDCMKDVNSFFESTNKCIKNEKKSWMNQPNYCKRHPDKAINVKPFNSPAIKISVGVTVARGRGDEI